MSHASSHAVVCSGLSFAWPDGTTALDRLDVAFDTGRTGLVGRNGSGKTTLLRLITGVLTPAAGTVHTSGAVGFLPQALPLDTGRTIAELLGIAPAVQALRAITAGDVSEANFHAVGDDWDVEERALEVLHRFGLPDDLDRTVGTISGGEAVLTGVAGLLVGRMPITLLDEPTNNLDRPARELLYEAVRGWPGVLVVVSHDRDLLECVDRIVELRDGTARTFGGTFSAFETALAVEQDAAMRQARAAEGTLRRERRQQIEAQTMIDRRARAGRKAAASKAFDKATAQYMQRRAQVTAGRQRGVLADRVDSARTALDDAEAKVRDDDVIRIDLPGTAVPNGRTVVELDGLIVRGPERIAVRGRNGSGKTTLLRRLVRAAAVPVGYLPQRLDLLDPHTSVLENVRAVAPAATPNEVRAQLARFLLRGDRVEQRAGTLSGGERFRATLACLLLADPAPQLLTVDEPTNNLDLDSVAQLVAALRAYRGALVVVSHDEPFLAELGLTASWTVDAGRVTSGLAP
ncbi:MAG TPA: ATP-binding cassette domain-containing protein [Jatrophihabitans sp.]|jgi:ATPase subunit of ABC transporter with duplicated ATPase domains